MMPSDLEQQLRDSLTGHAEAGSPIDPAPLLREATARGRAHRVRRQIASVTAIVVAVGLASVFGLVAGRPSAGHREPAVDRSSAPAHPRLPRMPAAPGASGALTDPTRVATDPRVLHFAVTALATTAGKVTWRSTGSYESADVEREDFQMYVAVTRNRTVLPPADSFSARDKQLVKGATWSKPSAVDIDGSTGSYVVGTPQPVGGRPVGDHRIWSLTWSPGPGLWALAEVRTTSLDRAVAIARKVDLGGTTRCAVPFRIGSPPPGAVLRSCSVALSSGEGSPIPAATGAGFANADLIYGDGLRTLQLLVDNDPENAGDYPRHLKAGPYRAFADPDGQSYTMLVKPLYFTAVTQASAPKYSQAQVLDALGSMRPVGSPERPETFD